MLQRLLQCRDLAEPSSVLSLGQARLGVAGHLLDAGQLGRVGHPWPDEIASQRWDGRDSKKPQTKVQYTVVVEVLADAAIQAGQWRHGLRYLRYRAELQPEVVPTLPDSGADG
jgi:hypothetical protein